MGEDTLSESTARVRFLSFLLSCFSGLALALVLIGTYALVSYDTARRTREVGIRMALGATAGRVERSFSFASRNEPAKRTQDRFAVKVL
jgi:ABC-type antimicrobial peptide transport system permease subunit